MIVLNIGMFVVCLLACFLVGFFVGKRKISVVTKG